MWYTPNAQLRYNRIYNFVVGVRGGGKTFNTLLHAIKKFKETGEQFIYLRRRATDLDDSCKGSQESGDLFADIRHNGYFPDDELKVANSKGGGYNFYLNEELMGFGYALSTAKRSSSRPKVTMIIFDEFLIDDTNPHERYLNKGNEMFLFDNFYETIARGRTIPTFFIGNAFSMVNPYFLALKIRIPDIVSNKIYKGFAWTFIQWKDESFIKERQKTQHYQARAKSEFVNHAFGNNYYMDRKEFLAKRTPESEHHFSIVYLGRTYGVWVDWNAGRYYVSTKGANTSKQKTISLSLADNSPNNVNIRKYRNLPFIKAFRYAVDTNEVYFDTQETFNQLQEIVYLLKTII